MHAPRPPSHLYTPPSTYCASISPSALGLFALGLHVGPGYLSCDPRAMEQDQSPAVDSADSGAAAFDFATGNAPSSAVTSGSAVAPDGGAQAADTSAYQAEHTELNGTTGDMSNYQSAGAAENGTAVTEIGEPVPEPSYEEGKFGLQACLIWYTFCLILTCRFRYAAVLSAEEARLWSVVTANCLDFNAWTTLIEETEKNAEVMFG